MAYRRTAGLAAVLVVLFAASTMMVQAGDATDDQSVYDWTVLKIKDITDSAYSTASEVYENSKKHAETISHSAKEYTDYAKDSFTKATSGKKESQTSKERTLDLLEQSKQTAFDKYQAAKDSSAESAETAKQQYDNVNAKLTDLTKQVKDKISGTHEEL